MQRTLLKKLRREVGHYHSKEFLKATMAVCALAAAADHEVTPDEIRRIDDLVLDEPALGQLDARKARQKLKEYLSALLNNRAKAERVLSKKISRIADNTKASRTLLRVAYLVMAADHKIRPGEQKEFERICGLLKLEPGRIWEELATRFLVWDHVRGAALVKASASETASLLNDALGNHWRAFERFTEAKTAAAAVYRKAIEELRQASRPTADLERRLAELPKLTIKQLPNVHDHTVGAPL
jgi:tellurite resistance protein